MGKAVTGASRIDQEFDIVANRMANAQTTGYKGEKVSFNEVLEATMKIDFSQGAPQPTGNPLDLSITGDGLFKVQTPQGTRYTRNGTFTIDREKYLVTQDGYRVLGESGPIPLTGQNVVIGEKGEISMDGGQVDKLKIVYFADIGKLKKEGASLISYNGDPADEKVSDKSTVQQGVLEQSNISVITEMTHLIILTRSYESVQKILQSHDEMNGKAANDVGSVK